MEGGRNRDREHQLRGDIVYEESTGKHGIQMGEAEELCLFEGVLG